MTSREHSTFVLKNEHSTSLLKALGQDQDFKYKQLPQDIGGQVDKLDWHKVGGSWRIWLPLTWVRDWFSVSEDTVNVLNSVQVAILEAMALEIRNSSVSLYYEPVFVHKVLGSATRLEVMTQLEELLGQLKFLADIQDVLKLHHLAITNWWLSGQGDELSSVDQQFQEIVVYFAKYSALLGALKEISTKMNKAEKFMVKFIELGRSAVDKQSDVSFQEALTFLETMTQELNELLTKTTEFQSHHQDDHQD